jgi:hypothetical protein
MTTPPTWAVYTLDFGTPILSLLAVSLAQMITRRRARELDARSGREESMRTVRWAAERPVNGQGLATLAPPSPRPWRLTDSALRPPEGVR